MVWKRFLTVPSQGLPGCQLSSGVVEPLDPVQGPWEGAWSMAL